jgi:hypothetical protein
MYITGKRRIATWALSAAALASFSLLTAVGCEKLETSARQDDRKVDENLAESNLKRETGGEKASDQALKALHTAAGLTNASNSGKVRAKGELAREEMKRALAFLPEINRRSVLIERALAELQTAGSQIQSTQQTATAYGQLEPKDALAKVEQDRGEIGKQVAKAKADAAAAQTEIDKRQQEINGLKEQRKKAEEEAESLAEKSANAKGEESVNLFKQSTEARIKAGTLAAEIESRTTALLPFQRTLVIAQQQALLWDSGKKENPGALQQLDERKQTLATDWQDAQAQMQAMNQTAKKIFDKSIVPSAEGGNAAGRLIKLKQENDAQRQQAVKLLGDASKHFGEGATAANAFHNEIQQKISDPKSTTSPDLPAWRALSALYDDTQYHLEQGIAQNALADVLGARALELQHDELAKTLQASQLALPKELAPGDADAAVSEAAKAYEAAEDTLNKVSSASRNSPDIKVDKDAALVALLHAHLARFQLTHDDKAKSAFQVDQAKAKEENVELPANLRGPIQ